MWPIEYANVNTIEYHIVNFLHVFMNVVSILTIVIKGLRWNCKYTFRVTNQTTWLLDLQSLLSTIYAQFRMILKFLVNHFLEFIYAFFKAPVVIVVVYEDLRWFKVL